MKKKALFFLITLLFIYESQITNATIFNPKEFTLANGMRCIVLENPTSPVVYHSLWVKVGSADEELGQSEKAHFLEHLMFRGTEKLGPGQYGAIISKLGGENNAWTSSDVTMYHVKIDKEHLDKIMEIEADRLTGLKIIDETFIPEKKVIVEEVTSHLNDPIGLMWQQLFAQLYLRHPYRNFSLINEIKELTREQVMTFYKKYYVPNNITLVISGDVKFDDIKKLAEKHYGPLKQRELIRTPRITEPPALIEKKFTLHHSQVTQPQIIRMYRLPKYSGKDAEKSVACEILAKFLGGNQSSKLYKKLVIANKQALEIECTYDNFFHDMGVFHKDDAVFIIKSTPNTSTDTVVLEKSIDEILTDFLKNGLTDEELISIKKMLEAESIYARDSLDQGANWIGITLAMNGQIADVENWNKNLESLTKEKVLEVAREVFDPTKSVTGFLRSKV